MNEAVAMLISHKRDGSPLVRFLRLRWVCSADTEQPVHRLAPRIVSGEQVPPAASPRSSARVGAAQESLLVQEARKPGRRVTQRACVGWRCAREPVRIAPAHCARPWPTSPARGWTASEKVRMVEETFESGATVSLVARHHGVAPNQLFRRRRLVAQGALTAAGSGARR
jgi:Transposase